MYIKIMNWGEPPIFEREIAGIPVGVTKDHDLVLYYWWKSQLKDATLFHVDGHNDMSALKCSPKEINGDSSLSGNFGIGDFIIPAMYHGIVSSVYWLNPHSQNKRLLDLGTTDATKNDRQRLLILQNEDDIPERKKGFVRYGIDRTTPGMDTPNICSVVNEGLELFGSEEVQVPEDAPLILDIDLDAFYCCAFVQNVPYTYSPQTHYQRRIRETLAMLRELRKPDLITITFSEGTKNGDCRFVPIDKAETIYRSLTRGLQEIYK